MAHTTRHRNNRFSVSLFLFICMLFVTLPATAGYQREFVVTSTGDNPDALPGDGICDEGTGACTLRAAIEEANALRERNRIVFNIGGGGHQIIRPGSALPVVSKTVVIDGATQPGYVDSPLIELSGQYAGPSASGLILTADENRIRALVINRFGQYGIRLIGSSQSIIAGNFLGTDVSGTIPLGNGLDGIQLISGSANNTIGGTDPVRRNLVSANGETGIEIRGSGCNYNIIQGNYIGTDITGTADLGNTTNGVLLIDGANHNVVGGTASHAGNLISGNNFAGVNLFSSYNTVQGNLIGADRHGTEIIPNSVSGMPIQQGAAYNVVGGTISGAGNVIVGNGNGNEGGIGFFTGANHNIVQGNYIGTDKSSTLNLGNKGPGIRISGSDTKSNLIGGTSPGASNHIAHNIGDGIRIFDGEGNTFSGNSIYANTDLGIDFSNNGVTLNDGGDGDSGPNTLQNFPAITVAGIDGGVLVVRGTISSPSPSQIELEFFTNTSIDPSGFGEGRTYTGSTSPDDSGYFEAILPAVSPGTFITATATDGNGNTSEFSRAIEVQNVIEDNLTITRFVLVDANSDTDLFNLEDESILDLSGLPYVNVRAEVLGSVQSVQFNLDTQSLTRTENVVPYALFGDVNSDYAAGFFTLGTNTITATAFSLSNAQGQAGLSQSISFEVTGVSSAQQQADARSVALEEKADVPEQVHLIGAYPNPFNPTTTIQFELRTPAEVSLAVYDMLGREVKQLVNGQLGAGLQEISFEAGELPSGTYLYRLVTPEVTFVRKMVLLK